MWNKQLDHLHVALMINFTDNSYLHIIDCHAVSKLLSIFWIPKQIDFQFCTIYILGSFLLEFSLLSLFQEQLTL